MEMEIRIKPIKVESSLTKSDWLDKITIERLKLDNLIAELRCVVKSPKWLSTNTIIEDYAMRIQAQSSLLKICEDMYAEAKYD